MSKVKATSAGYLVDGPDGLANKSWEQFQAESHAQRKVDKGAHFGHFPEDQQDVKLREQWDEAQAMVKPKDIVPAANKGESDAKPKETGKGGNEKSSGGA